MQFDRTWSGAPWESQVGYCRAVRAGNLIYVTGTTATTEEGIVFAPEDAYQQTKRCFEIIDQALQSLGANLSNVVRTRMYVTDINRWQEFGQAHREIFIDHPPATTMVEVQRLIAPEMLIEIEVDAVVDVNPSDLKNA
ncbi:MAG: RidA family protein [Microcoleaceae cyanobacterium]